MERNLSGLVEALKEFAFLMKCTRLHAIFGGSMIAPRNFKTSIHDQPVMSPREFLQRWEPPQMERDHNELFHEYKIILKPKRRSVA